VSLVGRTPPVDGEEGFSRVIVMFDYVEAAIGMHLNPFTEEDDSDSRHYVINTYRVLGIYAYYRIADTYQRMCYLIRYAESTVLLRYLKFQLDTGKKSNFVELSK